MSTNSSDVVPGTDAVANDYNKLRKDLVLNIGNNGTDADAATITIDFSSLTKGRVRTIPLAGNRTIAFSNATAGQSVTLIIKQTIGSNTITWPSIKWVGATAPVLTTTVNRYDIINIFYDGTDYFGSIVGQNYG